MSFLVSSPPVRGLIGGYILSPAPRAHVLSCVFTPGSRTHRGLHSVARSAGSCPFLCLHPRFVDSPGASVLSPAPRAHVLSCVFTPGSRTHRGLHSVARSAGSCPFLCLPPVRGLTGGYILSPAARARVCSLKPVAPPGSPFHRRLPRLCAKPEFSNRSYRGQSNTAKFCKLRQKIAKRAKSCDNPLRWL